MGETDFSERRYALLIDADNISPKYISAILDELSNYGIVTYRRIYGNWTTSGMAGWKERLLENSLTPMQQFDYSTGKNATDHFMVIDAMDILFANKIDGFCIASSDSDFTRLAARIRESGLDVIGMGEKKTPLPFRKACSRFVILENLIAKEEQDKISETSAEIVPTVPKEKIEQAVVSMITDDLNADKETLLATIGIRLINRYPDFDVRNYGTNQLKKLLAQFPSVSIGSNGIAATVNLVESTNNNASKSKSLALSKSEDDTAARSNAHTPNKLQKVKSQPKDKLLKVKKTDVKPKEKESKQPSNADIRDYIIEKLKAANKKEMGLETLSNSVRSNFKDFKVKNTGYSKFKDFVKSLDGIEVEQVGKQAYARLEE